MIDTHGPQVFHEEMMKLRTVREIEQTFGKPVSGEAKDEILPTAAMFGPKIGAFYTNLNGFYDWLVADRWFSQTHNRYSGNMVDDVERRALANASALKDAIRAAKGSDWAPFRKYGVSKADLLKLINTLSWSAWSPLSHGFIPISAPLSISGSITITSADLTAPPSCAAASDCLAQVLFAKGFSSDGAPTGVSFSIKSTL